MFSLFGSFSVDNLRPAKQARERFVKWLMVKFRLLDLWKYPFSLNLHHTETKFWRILNEQLIVLAAVNDNIIYYCFSKTDTKSIG